MMKAAANLPASIKALLQNKAKESNKPFAEVLQYFGMERFLFRLCKSEFGKKFVLKGALLFSAWQIPERRTTLDIDFLAKCDNQVGTIESMIRRMPTTKVFG